MNMQLIVNSLVIIALVGFIGVRQLSWRPVQVARMWRAPIILAVIGVVSIANTGGGVLSAFDLSLLVIEVVISLAVGATMGAIAQFRALGTRDPGSDATVESRTGWWGLALWVLFIAVRVGFDVWAGQMGSALAASTGVILLLIAANRVARTLVFTSRIDRHAGMTADRSEHVR